MKTDEFLKLASKKHKGLNRELLQKIAARLRNLRHEDHYDQAEWVEQTDCGTACCIAGWACLVTGINTKQMRKIDDASRWVSPIPDLATNLLGLTEKRAEKLFSAEPDLDWPKEYRGRWAAIENSESKEKRSKVAADLLDAIADGKVKL